MSSEKQESVLKKLCIRFIKAKRALISEQKSFSHYVAGDPALVNESLSEEEVMDIFEHPEKHLTPESRMGELLEELRVVSTELMPFFDAIRNRCFYIVYDHMRYQFFLNENAEIGFYIPALLPGNTPHR